MAAGGFGGILFPKSSSDDRPTPGLSDIRKSERGLWPQGVSGESYSPVKKVLDDSRRARIGFYP